MLTKSGKANPHGGHKFLQNAVHGVEEGMKIYGTLKGAFEVAKGAYSAASSAATAAAPYVEAAAAMMA